MKANLNKDNRVSNHDNVVAGAMTKRNDSDSNTKGRSNHSYSTSTIVFFRCKWLQASKSNDKSITVDCNDHTTLMAYGPSHTCC